MQIKMQIRSIGIDVVKTTFHLVPLGIHSQVLVRKKFSPFTAIALFVIPCRRIMISYHPRCTTR